MRKIRKEKKEKKEKRHKSKKEKEEEGERKGKKTIFLPIINYEDTESKKHCEENIILLKNKREIINGTIELKSFTNIFHDGWRYELENCRAKQNCGEHSEK